MTSPRSRPPSCRAVRHGSALCLLLSAALCGCSSLSQRVTNGVNAFRSAPGDADAETPGAPKVTAQACRQQGLDLAAKQRDDEAIIQLERARELAPGLSDVAHPLAVLYDRQGRWEDAAKEYRRALQEVPNHGETLCDYGYFLYCRAELPEAEQVLRKATKAAPTLTQARLNLGLVLAAQGRADDAYDEFEAVVGASAAHHNVGVCLTRAGRRAEGLAHLRQALELDPELSQTRAVLAQWDTPTDRLPTDGLPADAAPGGVRFASHAVEATSPSAPGPPSN